ncbi:MAG: hypothetical protein QOH50_1241 [Kribbellaceae bacterium]|nr:hypothetical protein [Kribbellaceae bacterium]
MPYRIFRTLPVDALTMMRAFHPMVVCFAAALAVTALVFDVFFLGAGARLALAALYTVPVLAGLVGHLIAAADDLGLERPVLFWTVAATVAVGLTNIALVATIGASLRTGPSDWRQGAEAVLFGAVSGLCIAVTAVVMGNLAHSLGIETKTRIPERRRRPAAVPVPVAASVAKSRPKRPARRRSKEPPPQVVEDRPAPELFDHPAPRVVCLSEPRPVGPSVEGTSHADRRISRVRRGLAVQPSRRVLRPGRPPGPGRFGAGGN